MKHNLSQGNHLDEEALIRLLDGELASRAANRARAHLESCWKCSQHAAQLRQAMNQFVEFEEGQTGRAVAYPPRSWNGFQPRLQSMALAHVAHVGRSSVGFARALGVVTVVAVLILSQVWLPSVSAKEILERSAASEKAALQSVLNAGADSLVVQRLRVESGRGSASWSLWKAPQSHRMHETWDAQGDGSLRTDIESLYRRQGFDAAQPISAANHSRWRRSLKHSTDSVTEDNGVMRVDTRNDDPTADGQIQEARLSIRTSDWRPVEESFRVTSRNATRQYRIVETSFHVEPLVAANSGIFDEPQPPAPPVLVARMMVPSAEISPLLIPSHEASGLPAANLADAEVEALATLHEIGADREESAVVERRAGEVRVTAWAATKERRVLIEQSLAPVEGVAVAVGLLSASADEGRVKPGVTIAVPPGQYPLFLRPLIDAAGSSAAANELVGGQTNLLAALMVQLKNVEDLNNRFPDSVRATLSASAADRLTSLLASRYAAAREVTKQLISGDGPLLGAMGSVSGDEVGTGSVACIDATPGQSAHATDVAQRLEDVYARAFTTTPTGMLSDASEDSLRREAWALRRELKDMFAEECAP